MAFRRVTAAAILTAGYGQGESKGLFVVVAVTFEATHIKLDGLATSSLQRKSVMAESLPVGRERPLVDADLRRLNTMPRAHNDHAAINVVIEANLNGSSVASPSAKGAGQPTMALPPRRNAASSRS